MNALPPVDTPTIIPRPARIAVTGGLVALTSASRILLHSDAVRARRAARVLQAALQRSMGWALPIVECDVLRPEEGSIQFGPTAAAAKSAGGAEGYELVSDATAGVQIRAVTEAGFFYAVQSLLQLLPPAVQGQLPPGGKTPRARVLELPAVRIVDAPRFRWRGLMLDVCRHFMPKADVLRHLDAMAMHKLNVFHWHLTDDQGWRVQIKKYPKLTEVGAYRRGSCGRLTPSRATTPLELSGTYGGFYTQDDVRQVVAYAAERHITVVPEIEMPGHATAALAAYPELSCTGDVPEVCTRMGVLKDVYCAGNEGVFTLLQDVLDELAPLFPSTYFHIGGDECPRDRWEACPKCQARVKAEGLTRTGDLQGYLIGRMAAFLAARGKRLIGWDEILDGPPLPAGATVMSWRGTEGGQAAARAGHDVVMTPHRYCYLDYAQAPEGEPPCQPGGLLPLEKVYGYDPIPPDLTDAEAARVLGLQGNTWTEYMPDMRHVEYMVWPRGAAIAEVGWSPADARDYEDFLSRLSVHEQRLAAKGVNFRPQPVAVTDPDLATV